MLQEVRKNNLKNYCNKKKKLQYLVHSSFFLWSHVWFFLFIENYIAIWQFFYRVFFYFFFCSFRIFSIGSCNKQRFLINLTHGFLISSMPSWVINKAVNWYWLNYYYQVALIIQPLFNKNPLVSFQNSWNIHPSKLLINKTPPYNVISSY